MLSEAKPQRPSAATATPNGALVAIPALDVSGWRVVIAVAEAARAGADAAVVVQAGAERLTTPYPVGLAGAPAREGARAGLLAV